MADETIDAEVIDAEPQAIERALVASPTGWVRSPITVAQRNQEIEQYRKQMVEGEDYGVIPGTDKPTLFQPGADTLCNAAGLWGTDPEFVEKVEDWQTGFFYYLVKLYVRDDDGRRWYGVGSCNSKERKYAAQSWVPLYTLDAEERQRAEAEEWPQDTRVSKRGNSIIWVQPPNAPAYDLVNTIQKMAQKRALIAATLIAVNASEFFTQDMEDLTIEGEYTTASVRDDKPALEPEAKPGAEPTPTPAAASAPPPQPAKPRKLAMVKGSADKAFRTAADEWAQQYPRYLGAEGHADYNHILASALLEGYAEITVENIRAVLDQVGQRHTIETLAEEAA